jgi:hypothetical protein
VALAAKPRRRSRGAGTLIARRVTGSARLHQFADECVDQDSDIRVAVDGHWCAVARFIFDDVQRAIVMLASLATEEGGGDSTKRFPASDYTIMPP